MMIFGNDETNADDTYSKLAGDLAKGTVSAILTSDLHPSAELTAFREEYKKQFNVEATPFAETSYDSIMMLAQVIKTQSRRSPRTCRRASMRFKVQGDFGRSRLHREEPHHDQRRPADAGEI